jgi:glycosyltransferase involved in cell wall biosynthesis
MGKIPQVTVLMPIYNAGPYLKEAVESILHQDHPSFCLMAINDASTDDSAKVLASFNDPRLLVIHNEKNLGVVGTLNKGLALTESPFLARMDQDDISLPGRLKKQTAFLLEHPNVGICGTTYRTFGRGIFHRKVSYTNQSEQLKAWLLFQCTFAHPSIMLRVDSFRKAKLDYQKDFEKCEDYDLWSRAARHMDFGFINEELLRYRIHYSNMSLVSGNIQQERTQKIRLRNLGSLFRHLGEETASIHLKICQTEPAENQKQLTQYLWWLEQIENANREQKIYDHEHLRIVLSQRSFELCYASSSLGLTARTLWKQNTFFGQYHPSSYQQLKFFIRWFFRIGGPKTKKVVAALRALKNKLRSTLTTPL